MSEEPQFDRNVAFSRTLGWITEAERDRLRATRVAIAGLGGAGGAHLVTLTRLGVGRFSIADFDRFELTNLNRQVGSRMTTLDRPKVEVLAELARDIAPDVDLRTFDAPVDASNVDAFLEDVDVFVDGIDLFAMDARRLLFRHCRERGIPAITACPVGLGGATMVFDPKGQSFEDYFQLEGRALDDQVIRFLVGLAPSGIQQRALATDDALDVAAGRAPSTPIGIQLAAGMAATELLKIVTGRGRLRPAPHSTHFDAFTGRIAHTHRRLGNRNPIQRMILRIAARRLRGRPSPASTGPRSS